MAVDRALDHIHAVAALAGAATLLVARRAHRPLRLAMTLGATATFGLRVAAAAGD